MIQSIETNLFDIEEVYPNCTVQVLTNSVTGEVSVGWFENPSGTWEESNTYHGFVCCSVCHQCYVEPEWITRLKWGFCPNCGAKMKGAEDGTTD